MIMSICVKATTVQQAIDEAKRRKIEGPFEATSSFLRSVVLRFVPTEPDRRAVVKWFCEPEQTPPFENGTLLFYSEKL